QGHAAGQRDGPWLSDFSHDEDTLAAVLLDGDGTLRVPKVAVCQFRFEVLFESAQRLPSGLHAANQRKAERPIRLDAVLSAASGLIVDLDRENVLRSDEVVACRLRRHDLTESDQRGQSGGKACR